jgi:coproporphyrinogen III oxidase-like Fe-S oxidoreductase
LFERHAGAPLGGVAANIETACAAGLLVHTADNIRPTALGHRFLNDLLQYFDKC